MKRNWPDHGPVDAKPVAPHRYSYTNPPGVDVDLNCGRAILRDVVDALDRAGFL